ncbi:HD domain-containing protein [Terriglobus saanensis]|uniref:Metal dependent phosphohydrolase n=1 Tax=Terriglobus saanensis (strain ATCC BAA-1853 / DSM 23119 / SP1PR4) TaxID=401053 RepID=E8V0R8_TERSS|nr:phosphohydrolase [Terriglobus saanensis]ADV81131.1 metal dependent phosphohydrolase [Terriglobus saanensis SP1PR4]
MAPWREELISYIRIEALPIEKFSHQPRLYALTQLIDPDADTDILFASVWLHDLGVFLGHRPAEKAELEKWDSAAYAVRVTPEILTRLGFPVEKIPAVVECIANHQPHNTPQSHEAAVLRDADILEQLGSVGILRTVCKVGRDTRFHTFAEAVASLTHALDTLPAKITLDRTRELAASRIAVLQHFLMELQEEARGEL